MRKKTSDTFLVSGLGYVLDKIHEILLLEIVFEHHAMAILPFKYGKMALSRSWKVDSLTRLLNKKNDVHIVFIGEFIFSYPTP